MTSTQLDELTAKIKSGDIKSLELLLQKSLSKAGILAEVSLFKGETYISLSGAGLQSNQEKVIGFLQNTVNSLLPGGMEFVVIEIDGKTKVGTSPATHCFICGSGFSGFSCNNDATSSGLSNSFGACVKCLIEQKRSWECLSCLTVETAVKGFRTPKCSKCSKKLILDKGQLLSQRHSLSIKRTVEEQATLSQEEAKERNRIIAEKSRKVAAIVTTTSNNVDGYSVAEYRGVIVGSAIAKGRMPTDDLSSRSLVGAALEAAIDKTMSESMQVYLMEATQQAESALKLAAFDVGADAVISIDIDYVGSKIMQVYMNGTAVCLEKVAEDSLS